MIDTDIVIIGGGISGLHTAYQLEKRGVSFKLIEARDRLGGRILSNNFSTESNGFSRRYDAGKPAYDLGPSWFWPGQTNIEVLIKALDLEDSVFQQQANGQAVYEDQQGNIQKGFFGISMDGAYRLRGGIRQVIDRLKKRIAEDKIHVSSQAIRVERCENELITTVVEKSNTKVTDEKGGKDETFQINSQKVILALPPRIALSAIEFKPSLPASRVTELNNYSTWMAGHAKFIAVYESPFWLEQGLSGDAVSQLGPLREIHDASTSTDTKGFALFGFVGVPGSYRKGKEDEICSAALNQLKKLFGDKAKKPIEVVLKDWAQERYTATEIDQSMNAGHATSSMSHYFESSFDNRLIWSGTETADHRNGSNGLIEGALSASTRTLSLI